MQKLAEHCGLKTGEIGFAGRKDARGKTSQRVSLPRRVESSLGGFESAQIEILETQVHGNKLRMGHLAGNRFALRLDGAGPEQLADLQQRAQALSTRGLANYYGVQRFGHDGSSAAQGAAQLLQGRARGPRRKIDFLISALQSLLYNDYLAQRIRQDALGMAVEGDLLKTARGGLFCCEDPQTDTQRLLDGEIVPTGPMYGRKMMSPSGTALTWESEILAARGLEPAHFSAFKPPIPGTRRPLSVPVGDVGAALEEGRLLLEFTLPSGSYATVLLRELLQHPAG